MTLYAFDLLQLNGHDLRREPVEARKAAFESCYANSITVSASVNTLSLTTRKCSSSTLASSAARAIVSKRLGSHYVFGRFREWIKTKNPNAPAVRREAEEDWR
jgi:ATP-dependent DNA ligase